MVPEFKPAQTLVRLIPKPLYSLIKLLQKRMMTVLMLSILSSDGAALQEFLSKWLADEPWQPYTAPAPGEF